MALYLEEDRLEGSGYSSCTIDRAVNYALGRVFGYAIDRAVNYRALFNVLGDRPCALLHDRTRSEFITQ